MPHVMKHKTNPVNGEPMAPKDLVRLNFMKNEVQTLFLGKICRLDDSRVGLDWIGLDSWPRGVSSSI